ncbi:multidrug effflux MFS transporter [Pedobacter gandavensis]|uniref:multidrug effflux MFS transporter n=1 Tax=Pedobacter gandavensis TaxID=2679963 RepID=UPI00247A58B3|nr:multidrug effflux MFS transporter [Pedobacter gandavensis]WGQ10892.1 multidrug effflux MFS transporter [Pedobacter gandavensis]
MQKRKLHPLLVTLTLGILTAIGSISIDMYLPAFSVMSLYFKVPMVRMETTVTLFLFGMSFGQLFIGPLSDVWGRKLPLKIGLSVYILCSVACMLTSSFMLLLALRFLQGLAGSACQVISRALVNDLYQGNRAAHVFTLLQILMGVSPILAPMVGGLLSDASTWKYLFLIMALLSGMGLLGCLTVLPDGKPGTAIKQLNFKGIRNAYSQCIKSPSFVNYALVRAVSNSAAFAMITGSPFVFTQIYAVSQKQFGFIFSMLAVGIIATGIINTRLLKHFEVKIITKYALIFQLITGAGMILVIYSNGPFYLLLTFAFLFLSMLGPILPNTTALYLATLPAFSGSASALIGSLSYLSAFLITSVLSLLHNNTAYPMVFTMWTCTIVALGCLLFRRKNEGDQVMK